jgi:hypothetical protein
MRFSEVIAWLIGGFMCCARGFGGKKVSQLPISPSSEKNFVNNCCNNKAAQQWENQ